jgi:hypothetical protein
VEGLWRLIQVFEKPEGAWTEDSQQYPWQVRYFGDDSLYGEYKGAERVRDRAHLLKLLRASAIQNEQQYVLGDEGLIYFYKNGNATLTMYCGIVQNTREPYRAGDMVLTFAKARATQLFLLYRPLRTRQPR